MLNCLRNLPMSESRAQARIKKAYQVLGAGIVKRIFGFAFFLLGAQRDDIAKCLGIPLGTFLSFLTRMDKLGLAGLKDRRKDDTVVEIVAKAPSFSLMQEKGTAIIEVGSGDLTTQLRIPIKNSIQTKVILLTLLQAGFIQAKDVANILGYSHQYTLELSHKLHDGDVEILFDKRQGQMKDYVFNPDIKAELIQQCALNAIMQKSTSSEVIANDLNERCKLNLSPRSIRIHLTKIGLAKLGKTLPTLLKEAKKNSSQ